MEPSSGLSDKIFYTIRAAFHAANVDINPSTIKEETKAK
jgi:hypothetical protein